MFSEIAMNDRCQLLRKNKHNSFDIHGIFVIIVDIVVNIVSIVIIIFID